MKNNHHSTTTVTHKPKELLDELQALVSEAETMIAGSDSDRSDGTLKHLRERFGDAQERLGEIYETTKKKVVSGAKQTDKTIREKPYQSLAAALGVGVLVGILIGRRGSK